MTIGPRDYKTIKINVSNLNESTRAPYWMVVDQDKVGSGDVYGGMKGPFFSRDEAQGFLDEYRYLFGDKTAVYCACSPLDTQYSKKVNF